MTRQWKPGDVASILRTGTQVALRTEKGWTYLDGSTQGTDPDLYDFRPLVVIDPEDREQVERLTKAFIAGWGGCYGGASGAMHTALNCLVTDPKPDEPMGLGAVVEDENGERWIRTHHELYAHWRKAVFQGIYRKWENIPAVRVLSEGVTP